MTGYNNIIKLSIYDIILISAHVWHIVIYYSDKLYDYDTLMSHYKIWNYNVKITITYITITLYYIKR